MPREFHRLHEPLSVQGPRYEHVDIVADRHLRTVQSGRPHIEYRTLGWGLIPLGAPSGGLLAHEFGLRAPYPIAGALRAIALLAALPALTTAIHATPRK